MSYVNMSVSINMHVCARTHPLYVCFLVVVIIWVICLPTGPVILGLQILDSLGLLNSNN